MMNTDDTFVLAGIDTQCAFVVFRAGGEEYNYRFIYYYLSLIVND